MMSEQSNDGLPIFHKCQPLHVKTPLLHSTKLSIKLDCNIFYKMENIQPSGSVKIRGIGNFCTKAVQSRGRDIHLISGSGLNTVLAVAYCARQLNVAAIVVMPRDTPNTISEAVRLEGAQLILFGESWAAAESHARKLVKRDGIYVPSADHAHIWEGHSSLIYELREQLNNNPPAAIICPVGGGGLLNGVIIGLQEVGWKEVPVIAVETHGSNAFQASVVAGKSVTIQKISTIASALACPTISSKSLELSMSHPVVPFAVSDAMAADAVRLFADDCKTLVEAASGAGLSLCYTQVIRDILPSLDQESEIVVLVTGGSDINLALLDDYRKKYYRPPVIVKSGSEVFLKMDDKLTYIQKVDTSYPMGISGENLAKINHKPSRTKELRTNSAQQTDTQMEEAPVSQQPRDENMNTNAMPSSVDTNDSVL
ncbi:tryptophan synthase beta subunit-like PLP-dependent enzyme [Mycotypha africana]|uniref:tryptophan synthase beta subunit-like PLP-dependent enzyme n=1 Tax=Mycotypha africana TaxID=64632 RepID=UPI0023007C5C|nr:tryptophan synthase beta subunit-like PLP-dependent enzyme [Mycotypha africana]KAI8991034.1 tryptophan synthase beta subunit-like PLP-dependent enzyme [Mycotypha africana]